MRVTIEDYLPETTAAGADATGEMHSLDTDGTVPDKAEHSSSTSATMLLILILDIFIMRIHQMHL